MRVRTTTARPEFLPARPWSTSTSHLPLPQLPKAHTSHLRPSSGEDNADPAAQLGVVRTAHLPGGSVAVKDRLLLPSAEEGTPHLHGLPPYMLLLRALPRRASSVGPPTQDRASNVSPLAHERRPLLYCVLCSLQSRV